MQEYAGIRILDDTFIINLKNNTYEYIENGDRKVGEIKFEASNQSSFIKSSDSEDDLDEFKECSTACSKYCDSEEKLQKIITLRTFIDLFNGVDSNLKKFKGRYSDFNINSLSSYIQFIIEQFDFSYNDEMDRFCKFVRDKIKDPSNYTQSLGIEKKKLIEIMSLSFLEKYNVF